MIKTVIINGFPGAGKDTFVELCTKYNNNYYVVNIHSSDPTKYALSCLGYTDKDKARPEVRDFLAHICTVSNTLWNTSETYLQEKIDQIKLEQKLTFSEPTIIFFHERMPENIIRLKNKFNALTLLISRETNMQGITNKADLEVLNGSYDLTIHNNSSLEELACNASDFMAHIDDIFRRIN